MSLALREVPSAPPPARIAAAAPASNGGWTGWWLGAGVLALAVLYLRATRTQPWTRTLPWEGR